MMEKITILHLKQVFVMLIFTIFKLFAQAPYPGEGTDSLRWVNYTKVNGDYFQDPADQPSTAGGDFFFSNSNPSSVALAFDGNNAFFRMQVEGNPAGSGGILNSIGVFVVELAPSSAIAESDFVVSVGIDGNSATNDYVFISNNGGSVDNVVYTYLANPGGFRSYMVPGENTYYVEFQVPLSSISSIWTGFNATTPLKLFFGTSSNHNNITKDFLNGNSVDFSVVSITDFESIGRGLIPVELINFSFRVLNNSVQLNWSTATETNNAGFAVEKNTDGYWNKIGYVIGQGTKTEISNYSYTDNTEVGEFQYRLKQIDFDGKYVYSKTLDVTVRSTIEKYILNQNYPNPFNPATTISYSLPIDGFVTLSIYDVLGNKVAEIENGNKAAGVYTTNFSGGNLTSGIYYYKLQAGSIIESKKMMLIK